MTTDTAASPVGVRPFADTAVLYRQAGWTGTLPLPPRAKNNPPDGWTGGRDRDPDDALVAYWAANGQADGNIALRLPHDIIGLDIDAYDAPRPVRDPATGATTTRLVHKRGAETLTELEAALGPLPPTWRSSARPAPSGIRLYRVPPGITVTESALPGDIEIIRRGHRYMVAPPSVNPETGTTCVWTFGAGQRWTLTGRPPTRDEIPYAPQAWLIRLSSRPTAAPVMAADSFWQAPKTDYSAARQWDRLRDRFVGFVRRCELFGWGGDAHGQLLELTRELAQLAPMHAHRAVGEWFAAGGAGYVDHRVWAMLESALGKYPADKIVTPATVKLDGSHGVHPTAGTTTGSHARLASAVESTSQRTAPGGDGSQSTPLGVGGGPVPGRAVSGVVSAGVGAAAGQPNAVLGAVGMSGPAGTQHTLLPHPQAPAPQASRQDHNLPGAAPRRLPMIPDPVWDAYGWTRSIRAQARAADVCPDAVLGAMLATYAARIPPGVRVVTGTKMPLSTNLVVALVGPSGSDKSTAFNLAQRISPGSAVPVVANPNSGEAFAAQFVHPDPDGEGAASKRAKVLKPDPRALFYVAEGALLGSVGARLGSTWLPHLRSLAVDEALSTTNATAEINRQVPAMSYSAGVIIGFQVTTASLVIHDTHTGTAQRFLWFTSLSAESPLSATTLHALLAEADVPMATPVLTRLGAGIDEENRPIHYLAVTQPITDRIRAEQQHTRLTRDITATDDHDAHRHTLITKLAAIAVLADSRVMIEERDWLWAEALYAASAATRDELLSLAEERDEAERTTAAARMGRADRVRRQYDSAESRVAEAILGHTHKLGGQITRREIDRYLNSRDRHLIVAAVGQLETHGYLRRTDSNKWALVSR